MPPFRYEESLLSLTTETDRVVESLTLMETRRRHVLSTDFVLWMTIQKGRLPELCHAGAKPNRHLKLHETTWV